MAALRVYTAQAVEEFINQKFIGNFLGRCAIQVRATDQEAESLGAKMQEDEQQINEVVPRANETWDGVSTVYDKVAEKHAGIEVMTKQLEETIEHNHQEASRANETLGRDAATEIGKLQLELIAKFGVLEAAAELKKTELQQ